MSFYKNTNSRTESEKIYILYISYDGMTDQLGQSQVIPYLKNLSKKGNFNFVLLSCEKKENFKKNKKIIDKSIEGHSIEWKPILYHKTPPVFSTIFDFFLLQYHAILLHKRYNFSMSHCRSYLSSLIGLKLKEKFGIPFIFDMRGFWADERVDGKMWNLKNPLYLMIFRYFKKKEKEFILKSSAIVSLTKAGKREMLLWDVKVDPEKIKVIPCCADLTHFSSLSIDNELIIKIKTENNIKENDFVLTYLGAIGSWYMLPEMLTFFYLLHQRVENSKFLFIVPSYSHDIIYKEAVRQNLSINSIILIHGQRKDIPTLLSLSSYAIYFIFPFYSKISSSPTKQGEIMAMGIPSIINRGVGDTEEIINENNAGIVVQDFSESTFQNVIDQVLIRENNRAEIIKGANAHYSLSMGANEYYKIYKMILKLT